MLYEALKTEKILEYVMPFHLKNLSGLEILNEIDSTNRYLMQKAKKGLGSGFFCLAETQTKGQGRLGRQWFSQPHQNICCSLFWHFARAGALSGLSIAIAVIVAEVLHQYDSTLKVQLKWPNDIVVGPKKLGGILLESFQHDRVVVGIGLNLNLPDNIDPHWIDVKTMTGRLPERNKIAGLLINELLAQLEEFDKNGLKAFMPRWQQLDALFGNPITITTHKTKIKGVMRGLDEQGQLLLQDETGAISSFAYGEASLK